MIQIRYEISEIMKHEIEMGLKIREELRRIQEPACRNMYVDKKSYILPT